MRQRCLGERGMIQAGSQPEHGVYREFGDAKFI